MKKLVLLFLFLISGQSKAQTINFPDANFKARLLAANSNNSEIAGIYDSTLDAYFGGATIDLNGDGEIQIAEAQSIQLLNVHTLPNSPFAIRDLTGIEYFTNLRVLSCYFNELNSLDLSQLTHLISVTCDDNELTSLNLDGLTNLKYLGISGNQFTSFDFSILPNLQSADCSSNLFTELDFHNNPVFFDLGAGNNPLLTSINIQNNVQQNTGVGIYQFDGFLNCPNLHNICVDEVEREALQSVLDWNELHWGGSRIVCSSNCSLATNENQVIEVISVFPNPAQNSIQITSQNSIKSIQLFDLKGRLLIQNTLNENQAVISLSDYAKGIYFLKVASEEGMKIQKIVKE